MDSANPGKRVYLDNAATSYPKPPEVWESMERYMRGTGASPGRGGYRNSLDAGRVVFEAREAVAQLFHASRAERVVFTPNVTYSLNFAIHGLLRQGDHVVTTSMEHNSVMRPLRFAQSRSGVGVTVVQCDAQGRLDPEDLRRALRPDTKMIVMTHASNVAGTLMPVAEVAGIAREFGVFMVVDAAQSAGAVHIDLGEMPVDVLAFTGHKGLYGPPGTGGMVLSARAATEIAPLVQGGTGSRSDEEFQPGLMPDKFEPGTPNTVGIAGLGAGIRFVLQHGESQIGAHELQLAGEFARLARETPGVRLLGPWDRECDTGVDTGVRAGVSAGVSATANTTASATANTTASAARNTAAADRVATVSVGFTSERADASRAAFLLDSEFGVMVRSGLHCAPLAHKTIGTFPAGTLRFSFGWFNTIEDARYAASALASAATGN